MLGDFEFARHLRFSNSDIFILFLVKLNRKAFLNLEPMWQDLIESNGKGSYIDLVSEHFRVRITQTQSNFPQFKLKFMNTNMIQYPLQKFSNYDSNNGKSESQILDIVVQNGNNQSKENRTHDLHFISDHKTFFVSSKLILKDNQNEREYSEMISEFLNVLPEKSERSFPIDGSKEFQSPAVIKKGLYSFASDYWALACSIYQMMYGKIISKNPKFWLLIREYKTQHSEFPNFKYSNRFKLISKKLFDEPPYPDLKTFFPKISFEGLKIMKILFGFGKLPRNKWLHEQSVVDIPWFKNSPESFLDFHSISGPFFGNGGKLNKMRNIEIKRKINESGYLYRLIEYQKNPKFFVNEKKKLKLRNDDFENSLKFLPQLKNKINPKSRFLDYFGTSSNSSLLKESNLCGIMHSKRSTIDHPERINFGKSFLKNEFEKMEFLMKNNKKDHLMLTDENKISFFLKMELDQSQNESSIKTEKSVEVYFPKKKLESNRKKLIKTRVNCKEVNKTTKRIKRLFQNNINQKMIAQTRIRRFYPEKQIKKNNERISIPSKLKSLFSLGPSLKRSNRLKRMSKSQKIIFKDLNREKKKENRFKTGRFGVKTPKIKRFWERGEFAKMSVYPRKSDLCSPFSGPDRFGKYKCYCHMMHAEYLTILKQKKQRHPKNHSARENIFNQMSKIFKENSNTKKQKNIRKKEKRII